tara:strand:+ start:462 stop:707 length:246 start_codon:yes stop_codon:yes gene_type:complete
MTITHCLLVNPDVETAGLTRVEYIESKFPRELGDTMKIGEVTYKVGAIGCTRDHVVACGNDLVRLQNKHNRARAKANVYIK